MQNTIWEVQHVSGPYKPLVEKWMFFRGRWNRASHAANDGNTSKNINPNKKWDTRRLNMHETQILSSKDVHFISVTNPKSFGKAPVTEYTKTKRKHRDNFPVWTGSLLWGPSLQQIPRSIPRRRMDGWFATKKKVVFLQNWKYFNQWLIGGLGPCGLDSWGYAGDCYLRIPNHHICH